MAESALVGYRVEDGVAVLTLANAPANCYTHELMRDLDRAILEARFDDDVFAIVLTGEGAKFFSAGADIKMLQAVTPRFKYWFCLHANETLCRLEATSKIVIAALNGHAVGGGLEVALAADLRVGWKASSGKLGLPEVNLGVLPGTGGTQRLVRMVGKARAIELMATGRTFDMAEAHSLGLVDRLIEGETVEDFQRGVLDYARQFVPPGKAAKAVGAIKRACQSGAEIPFGEGLALERELQQQLFLSQDSREGLAAYTEKRTPSFQGI